MTTKAAALALRKGEQKGAIAAKKATHERVRVPLAACHCACQTRCGHFGDVRVVLAAVSLQQAPAAKRPGDAMPQNRHSTAN